MDGDRCGVSHWNGYPENSLCIVHLPQQSWIDFAGRNCECHTTEPLPVKMGCQCDAPFFGSRAMAQTEICLDCHQRISVTHILPSNTTVWIEVSSAKPRQKFRAALIIRIEHAFRTTPLAGRNLNHCRVSLANLPETL